MNKKEKIQLARMKAQNWAAKREKERKASVGSTGKTPSKFVLSPSFFSPVNSKSKKTKIGKTPINIRAMKESDTTNTVTTTPKKGLEEKVESEEVKHGKNKNDTDDSTAQTKEELKAQEQVPKEEIDSKETLCMDKTKAAEYMEKKCVDKMSVELKNDALDLSELRERFQSLLPKYGALWRDMSKKSKALPILRITENYTNDNIAKAPVLGERELNSSSKLEFVEEEHPYPICDVYGCLKNCVEVRSEEETLRKEENGLPVVVDNLREMFSLSKDLSKSELSFQTCVSGVQEDTN